MLARRWVWCVWLVVGLVIPGAILWGATLDAPMVSPAQPVRNWVAGYLYADHQFGQVIPSSPHDLVGVRVWLLRPVAPRAGVLQLTIQPAGSDVVLARASLPVAALLQDTPATFRFDPVPLDRLATTKPAPTLILIRAEGVDRSQAVSVLAGPNVYPNGALFRDGRLVNRADLAFDLLYRASWFDRLVPITAIARGRSGVLGWAPLYALLVYGMIAASGNAFYVLAKVVWDSSSPVPPAPRL